MEEFIENVKILISTLGYKVLLPAPQATDDTIYLYCKGSGASAKGFVSAVKRGDMMSVDDVTEILAVPLIGILPDDEQVVIGTNQGEPVIGLDSKAGKGYLNICKRITGTEVSFMNLDTGKGLFSRISHAFRKN